MATLRKTCGLSYVAGAPRHRHRGAVFELRKEGGESSFMPVLEGEQVPAGEGPSVISAGDRRPEGKDGLGHTAACGPAWENAGSALACVSGCRGSPRGHRAAPPDSCVTLVNSLIQEGQGSRLTEGVGASPVLPVS